MSSSSTCWIMWTNITSVASASIGETNAASMHNMLALKSARRP